MGANYLVTDGTTRVGVFTVVRESLQDWPMIAVTDPVPWLRALATHPDHRGSHVGRVAIRAAIEAARPSPFLYLDCVSGFLPEYYASNGFELVAQQIRSYPDEGSLDITLMRYRIP